MKRTSFLLLVSLFFVISSSAQLRIGILGGINQSDIVEKNDLPNWNTLKNNYSRRTGGHFGFIADLPLGNKANFCFQPGVIFYTKGRKYFEVMDTTMHDTLSVTSAENINYIDIPFNLVVKFNLGKKVKFIVGGGTYLSFYYNGNIKTQTISKDGVFTPNEIADPPVGDGPGKYRTYDFGVNGLAGFEFGRAFLTAKYSRGLNNMYESPAYDGNFKNELAGVSLGVFLGKPVKFEEKTKDKDKDGVADKEDKCPDAKGLAKYNGCPDTDNDGLQDSEDKCPGEAGFLSNAGCPILDKDKDGIVDKDDKCPDVAGFLSNGGCPLLDSDKDGIADADDKCPSIAGLARHQGCPVPDTDGDGINDEEDKCPAVKGLKAINGCPEEIKKEIVAKVNYAARRIQFSYSQANLLPSSYKVLDEVVNILNQNPELKLSIEGHTSGDAAYDANMKLSQDRANNVKAYLKSKGIDPSRLSAKGFGPNKPLSTGTSAAEKAKNRRVELKLSNQ
jgi:OOP family OmpA-OmpF porin